MIRLPGSITQVLKRPREPGRWVPLIGQKVPSHGTGVTRVTGLG
jgi:hypothetical protein